MDDLLNRYHSGSKIDATSSDDSGDVSNDLLKKYHSSGGEGLKVIVNAPEGYSEELNPREKLVAGGKQGIKDVVATVGQGVAAVDYLPGGTERSKKFNEKIKKENEEYEAKYGSSKIAQFGRAGGQALATTPFVPAKAINAIEGATAGLPVAGKLIGDIGTGLLAGGEYGALTSSSNDKGIIRNTTEGAVSGAIANPISRYVGNVVKRALPTTNNLWAGAEINALAKANGMDPAAVKNVVGRLADAGYTPQQADQALKQLGSNATLADLDSALTAEASGLAAYGGKATTILKNRYNFRQDVLEKNITPTLDAKLGPKIDIEAEKENIVNAARKATAPDYEAAKANTTPLDTSSIVKNIDDQLKDAVGAKAAQLNQIKSYFFKTVKDSQGNEQQVLKNGLPSLHQVRIELDDMLNRLPSEGSSKSTGVYRAVSNIRDQLDETLKSIPEMAAADAKFAAHMKVRDALDFGREAITKGLTREEFTKAFNAASPDEKAAIRKGMRVGIGDVMERSAQGELTGAQRLFAKKSVNQENLKTAYGADAEDALNALHRDLSFKETNKGITQGSQTAERQAIAARYAKGSGSVIGDIGKGLIIDALHGFSSGGAGTTAAVLVGGKTLLKNQSLKLSEGATDRLVEGTADLLSRSSINKRDAAMSVLERVSAINQAAENSKLLKAQSAIGGITSKIRLPVTLPAALAQTEVLNRISPTK